MKSPVWGYLIDGAFIIVGCVLLSRSIGGLAAIGIGCVAWALVTPKS
jgi:hypothetical protein